MTHLMNTYNRLPVAFTHGKGARLYDAHGREYLDALARGDDEPEWALPGFGQAGDDPITANFTAVYCPRGSEDTRRHRQARPRWARPWSQSDRARLA